MKGSFFQKEVINHRSARDVRYRHLRDTFRRLTIEYTDPWYRSRQNHQTKFIFVINKLSIVLAARIGNSQVSYIHIET